MKKISITLFFLYYSFGFEANGQNQDSIAFVHAFKFYKALIDAKLPDKFYKVLGVIEREADTVNVKNATKYQIYSAGKEKIFYTFSFNNTNINIANFYDCYGIQNITAQNGTNGCSNKQVINLATKRDRPDTLYFQLESMVGRIPIYMDPWMYIKNNSKIKNKVVIQSKDNKFIKQGDKWIKQITITDDIRQPKQYSLKEALEELKINKKTSNKILKMTF
jgi:hypothetical protein